MRVAGRTTRWDRLFLREGKYLGGSLYGSEYARAMAQDGFSEQETGESVARGILGGRLAPTGFWGGSVGGGFVADFLAVLFKKPT